LWSGEGSDDNNVNCGATGLGTERLLYGIMGTEAVTVCPSGCRLSVRSSWRAWGHDKRTHRAHTGYLEEALVLCCGHAAGIISFTVNRSADPSGRGV
jgi:hypothetical protein